MKKFLKVAIIVLCLVMAISMVACNKTLPPANTDNNDTTLPIEDLTPANPNEDGDTSAPMEDLTPAQWAYGAYSYNFLKIFNAEYNKRTAGSEGEIAAANYIATQLNSFGYSAEKQNFSFSSYNSQNVIAKKQGKDTSKTIIIGAHYDSVNAGFGIDDNASGVAVMLEAAKFYSDKTPSYNLIFIAFGAEEKHLKGSNYYVSQMSEDDIANTKFMVNLDTLAAGDKMYAYGGADEFSQELLGYILNFGKEIGLETQQGLNANYAAGTTGDWSDHAPFKYAGIPFIYFEATNWEIKEADGTYSDGYLQIEDGKGGIEVMHSELDNLDWIEENFAGRVETHMTTFAKCLIELIK